MLAATAGRGYVVDLIALGWSSHRAATPSRATTEAPRGHLRTLVPRERLVGARMSALTPDRAEHRMPRPPAPHQPHRAHEPHRAHRGRSEEHTSELQSRGHLVCR